MTTSLRRPAGALLAGVLCSAVLTIPAATTASATPAWTGGWLRLAHFSPGAPAVDVYLYPFGGSKAAMVLKNVSYGHASPYESVAHGQYTVAMRLAGAAPSVAPVISSTVRVAQGKAYTVAGLGPGTALELRTLPDQLSAPADQASVRVIQASLNQPSVSVRITDGGQEQLRFPMSTPYRTVPAGSRTVKVSAGSASTSRTLRFAGRSTHTLVVLSATGSAPKLLDLTDSSGPDTQPVGGVEAGLGGLNKAVAPQAGGRSATGVPVGAWWSGALVVTLGAVLFAVRRRRRT